LRADTLKQRA